MSNETFPELDNLPETGGSYAGPARCKSAMRKSTDKNCFLARPHVLSTARVIAG
jgi:hypothetical protein